MVDRQKVINAGGPQRAEYQTVGGDNDLQWDTELRGLPVRVDQHGNARGPEEGHVGEIGDDRHGIGLLEQLRERRPQPRPSGEVDLAGGGEDDGGVSTDRRDPQESLVICGGAP